MNVPITANRTSRDDAPIRTQSEKNARARRFWQRHFAGTPMRRLSRVAALG